MLDLASVAKSYFGIGQLELYHTPTLSGNFEEGRQGFRVIAHGCCVHGRVGGHEEMVLAHGRGKTVRANDLHRGRRNTAPLSDLNSAFESEMAGFLVRAEIRERPGHGKTNPAAFSECRARQ